MDYGIQQLSLHYKLGLLTNEDNTEDGLTKWDSLLSKYLAELVKDGVLSYQDLWIVDESRRKSVPYYRYSDVPYSNIIISTEKDTVYNIIADIASLFGCSCISGKGQCSLAAMEDLLRKIKRDNPHLTDIYILTMTDYDPSGYYIADTFRQQAEELKPILGLNCNIHIDRIGIFPNQLTADEIEQNKYTPKPTNLVEWLKITGGINGEPKGLELDSLSPERIRSIFATSLKNYIDQDNYVGYIKETYLRNCIQSVVQPYIDYIINDITEQKKQDVTVLPFDLFQFAEQGRKYIPVNNICSLTENNLIQIAQQYFKL